MPTTENQKKTFFILTKDHIIFETSFILMDGLFLSFTDLTTGQQRIHITNVETFQTSI